MITEKQAALYSDLFQRLQLTELMVEEEGCRISLKKDLRIQEMQKTSDNSVINKIVNEKIADKNGEEIKAPLLGIFHRCPAPEEPAFVEEGTKVKKGDILCVIEAMKMMNEITALKDGTIKKICAEENTIVEFGQTIFEME